MKWNSTCVHTSVSSSFKWISRACRQNSKGMTKKEGRSVRNKNSTFLIKIQSDAPEHNGYIDSILCRLPPNLALVAESRIIFQGHASSRKPSATSVER